MCWKKDIINEWESSVYMFVWTYIFAPVSVCVRERKKERLKDSNSCEIMWEWAKVKWALVTRKMSWDLGDWGSVHFSVKWSFSPSLITLLSNPQWNHIHRYKYLNDCWISFTGLQRHHGGWPTDGRRENQYTCTHCLSCHCRQNVRFDSCPHLHIHRWVLYAYACVYMHMSLFLLAEVQPGCRDFSLWLLSQSQRTLCRREISCISSFMWCTKAEGVRG